MAKMVSELPKNKDGFKWVVATYRGTIILDDVEYIETPDYPKDEELARAYAGIDRTVQVKQYEPMKMNFGCSVPCWPGEVQSATKYCHAVAKNVFSEKFEEALAAMKKRGLR